jgi:transposase
MKKPPSKSRHRAEAIMKVRCGLMTATEAAAQLGVSRKTYYQWERRGLAALLDGLCDQRAGRPEKPEQESALEKQLADSLRENELLRQQMALKDIVSQINLESGSDRTKKK